ncbi:isoprenylcysteine carboxylmethyltransferase family protein [Rhodanobacter sp. AS-Z3]|uniref:methyltransferase family protein n=1 Tax=Rhodanobacter sp. AS-Z3 TaxID=3031330 RepID=UPI0024787B96|nr:isoprenylcysteine carboxylmethyltransferase family protein [Rhodanobacter sp. AS-Z3]WEN13963.1 isoprenylcysteine carboxylmethyltransferase family protein [Rhodanobacter sp. AS-Z3]
MSTLELKIPPPVIALSCMALAWLLAQLTPGWTFVMPARIVIAVILALAGMALALAGFFAFRRARTTPNPHTPEKATTIVQSGPYRFTRNPMYLGLALVLLGVCAYLANPLTLVTVVVFIAYLTRFQVMPEERVLLATFGEPYQQYTRSVSRWL